MNHDSCRHAALLSKRAEHTHEQNNNKTRQDNKTRHTNETCLVIDFSCLLLSSVLKHLLAIVCAAFLVLSSYKNDCQLH
jgi:hypothetical protein